MDRRDFLKIVGISTVAGTATLYGCKPKTQTENSNGELGPIPTDQSWDMDACAGLPSPTPRARER